MVTMVLARWLPTFLAFPIGGYIAIQTLDSIHGPFLAAVAGALAGIVIGLAQWIALRPRGTDARWVIATAAGMALGSSLASLLTGDRTDIQALMLSGLITGALIGGSQALLFRRGRLVALVWTTLVSVSWASGWLVTASIGVDVERGYVVFGASGALVATALTGLGLWRLLGNARLQPVQAGPQVTA
jgi:hypothetical protein